MKVSVIGNGFDLRHGLPTRFQDFLDYYAEEVNTDNLVYRYLVNVNLVNGWLDFEQEMQSFLIHLSKFVNTVSSVKNEDYTVVDYNKFVVSPNTEAFYKIIKNRNFPFFRIHTPTRSLRTFNDQWVSILTEIVESDIEKLRIHLNRYLKSINIQYFNTMKLLDTQEITTIKTSDSVITFNYTNFLEHYIDSNKIIYAHGNFESEIVLGIPYTNEITMPEFNKVFKTNQSIYNNYNSRIEINSAKEFEFNFIGFSFGKSDHYYFQEVLDIIERHSLDPINGMAKISFNFYYHDEASKHQYISNLRDFMGEKNLVRFNLEKRIRFIKLENL